MKFWQRFVFLGTVFILIFIGLVSVIEDSFAGIVLILPVLIISIDMGLAAGMITSVFFSLLSLFTFVFIFPSIPVVSWEVAGGTLSIFMSSILGNFFHVCKNKLALERDKVQELEKKLQEQENSMNAVLAGQKENWKQELKDEFNQNQEKSLGTLASLLVSDLSPEIISVLNQTQLLYSELHSPRHREMMKSILINGNHLSDWINRMTALADNINIDAVDIELNDFLESLLSLYEKKQDIELKMKLCNRRIIISGDLYWLRIAFFYILENVFESIKGSGTLCLSLNYIPDEKAMTSLDLRFSNVNFGMIEISDTGDFLNIREGELFFSILNSRYPAAGLRLAAVNNIIQNHGGYIKTDSGINTENRIRIYLPVLADIDDISEPNYESEKDKIKGILVIDDEPLFRDLLEDVLSLHGYRVLCADSGHNAIEIFRARGDSVNLIILDNILPDMNGLDIFRELKNINPGIKSILTSGYDFDETLKDSLDSGIIDFMKKPFSTTTLLDVINNFFL